jgi:DNA (cytosine-5)-methyltransferase 1
MTGLSLFSGVGGMDLAAEAAGIRTVAFCEIEPFCQEVLQKRWPGVPIFGDIRQVTGERIFHETKTKSIDVVFGGFPCQGFSVSGLRNGKEDPRYLWPEFSRLVGELRPAWIVAENVPGILSLAADDICEDLERKGYSVGIFCHEATALGAPHRRMRVFFVAHAKSGRPQSRVSQ